MSGAALRANKANVTFKTKIFFYSLPFLFSESLKDARFCQSTSRMSHFIRDSTSLRGIIKEFDISPDGRVIASPYDTTVRLLAFDDQVSSFSFPSDGSNGNLIFCNPLKAREICDQPPPFPTRHPKPLVVVKTLDK